MDQDFNKRVLSFFFIEDKSKKKSIDSMEYLESNGNVLITSPNILVQNMVWELQQSSIVILFIIKGNQRVMAMFKKGQKF